MAERLKFHMEVDMKSADMIEDILGDAMDQFMDEMAEEIEWSWRRAAAAHPKLNTTKKKYLEAIEVERKGDGIEMRLTGDLASALESGSDPYDLKPGFLKGHGKSRVIPIVKGGVTKFRTVSYKSNGWIHPGQQARNIIDEVNEDIKENLMGEVFSKILSRSTI